MTEAEEIYNRYLRRIERIPAGKYALTNPHVLMGVQEKERRLVRMFNKNGLLPLGDKKILEIGCGTGSNILDLVRLGASPENMVGNDLLWYRLEIAQKRLPSSVRFLCCEASTLDLPRESFDIVLQSTVFASILDGVLRMRVAQKMWEVTKPGGCILWYDFIHANPNNRDVRAVSVEEVKRLFPNGRYQINKTTLFPFLSARVTHHVYFPYTLLNAFPFLRMHILCLIQKP